ncbi:PREDICTED: keratin-associated protein 15-1-like [Hipposideros armiger]|uniref:Keratin-associated protein n=1 Tax=Hipposideros armiger TaxID=186990 RepID=A0A8B7SB04_HIPAR|nr:PREDICTED: keratin-associated protein 15-1-like [Hipposideros armiger]
MSYNCRSGNFSSRSFGGCLQRPVSFHDTIYPSKVVLSPSTCQLGSSTYDGCQETCWEPTSCQTPCSVASSYQTSCFRPRNSMFCSPCQTNYAGSSGCGNIGLGPFGYGSAGFQSPGCGSGFYRPSYLPSRGCPSTCYQPAFSSRCFGSTY